MCYFLLREKEVKFIHTKEQMPKTSGVIVVYLYIYSLMFFLYHCVDGYFMSEKFRGCVEGSFTLDASSKNQAFNEYTKDANKILPKESRG